MKYKFAIISTAVVSLLAMNGSSIAAVSADEAAKLKSSLTPLGGEKAGNKEGTIPAWDGKAPIVSGAKVGDVPVELFPNEKSVLQITAKNSDLHASKLSDGTLALLKKHPESFRVDVYPTHRTGLTPNYVTENTFKNATNCKTKDNGQTLEGCYGGIPFPIPKTGVEAIWNYLLRVEAESVQLGFKNIVGTSSGSRTLATRNDASYQFPNYYKDGSVDKWNGEYMLVRFSTTEPPFKAGESIALRDSVDVSNSRQAWQYLVGQRRVRRAPTVAYDTPDFVASGANYFDEVKGFFGQPDRYNWKLIGKKEMYVPYNTNAMVTASVENAFGQYHLNPDKLRWELHRVWEVEATVADGKRHAVPKRKFYFDEDTWLLVLMDGYDTNGKLWRTTQMTPFHVPAIPANVVLPATIYNLQANTYSAVQAINGEAYRVVSRKPERFFTGDALAAESAR